MILKASQTIRGHRITEVQTILANHVAYSWLGDANQTLRIKDTLNILARETRELQTAKASCLCAWALNAMTIAHTECADTKSHDNSSLLLLARQLHPKLYRAKTEIHFWRDAYQLFNIYAKSYSKCLLQAMHQSEQTKTIPPNFNASHASGAQGDRIMYLSIAATLAVKIVYLYVSGEKDRLSG